MNNTERLQEIKRRAMTFNQKLREIDLEGHIDWLIEQAEKVEELESKSSNLRAMARDQRVAFRTFMRHHLHLAVEEGMLDLSDIDIESIIFFAENDWSFLDHFVEFIKHYIKWNKENIWPKDDESSDET